VWEIRPEWAAGRPSGAVPGRAPERFIRLYTYAGDVVLDPSLGSARRLCRSAHRARYGVRHDPEYVAIAEARVAEARAAAD
jgi:site-specific DNA-methyltransferase (adenine-specific)